MWRCGPLIRGTRLWRKKSWPFLAFLKAASLTQAGPSDKNDNDHTGANDDLKPASCAGCERERRMEEVQPLCLWGCKSWLCQLDLISTTQQNSSHKKYFLFENQFNPSGYLILSSTPKTFLGKATHLHWNPKNRDKWPKKVQNRPNPVFRFVQFVPPWRDAFGKVRRFYWTLFDVKPFQAELLMMTVMYVLDPRATLVDFEESAPAALQWLHCAHSALCSTVTDWIAQCFKANLHWQWRTKVHTNASLHCRAGALTESLEQKLQNFCFRQISIELEFFVIALLRMGRALEKDNI